MVKQCVSIAFRNQSSTYTALQDDNISRTKPARQRHVYKPVIGINRPQDDVKQAVKQWNSWKKKEEKNVPESAA